MSERSRWLCLRTMMSGACDYVGRAGAPCKCQPVPTCLLAGRNTIIFITGGKCVLNLGHPRLPL